MKHHLSEIELMEAARLHPTRKLQKAWGGFVAQWPWEWFVTLTFCLDLHPERALKLYRFWCSLLNREIYGRYWYRKEPFGVTWVVAVERQNSGRVHLHALIAGVGETRRLSWMDTWLELDKVSGFARIEPVNDRVAVSSYVSKYVAKDGDLEFSPNLRIRLPDLFDPDPEPESET